MQHDLLIEMLNRLKLTAIRDQLDSLIDEAGRRELSIRESLSLFCEREIARKDERRIEMSIGLARFPFVRDLDGFDFAAQPSHKGAAIGRAVRRAGMHLLFLPQYSPRSQADRTAIRQAQGLATQGKRSVHCCRLASYRRTAPLLHVSRVQQLFPSRGIRFILNRSRFNGEPQIAVYVIEEDLAERGIDRGELVPGIKFLSHKALPALFAEYDIVSHW